MRDGDVGESGALGSVSYQGADSGGEAVGRGERRWRRVLVGGLVLLALGYVLSVITFAQGLVPSNVAVAPPEQGVRVVFVPERINAADQSVSGKILIFPAATLLDEAGHLREAVEIDVSPSVDGGTLVYRADALPEPKGVVLAAPGVLQEYPFDSYVLDAQVSAASGRGPTGSLPIEASVYFRVPNWRMTASEGSAAADTWAQSVTGTFSRDGSTRFIAAAILILMIILASIAVALVVGNARGRRTWAFVHATWLTTMLFALLPLRSSLPGNPPLGVWIDVLVFFWVELAVMVCVAVTAFALVLRVRPDE